MKSQTISILGACLALAACTPATRPAQPTATPATVSAPETPAVPTVQGPPVAEQRPVTHTYHGVDVVDPYEWLENPADPAVQAWSDAENAYARRHLDALPNRAAIHARLQEILATPQRHFGAVQVRGGKLFALETLPPREQPFIVVLDDADAPDAARTVVDTTALDAEGGTSIDWFEPSPDGALVAVSLSRGGSERGDLHIFETATGAQRPDVVEHVNGGTGAGDVAWAPDSAGLYYTRYPRTGERPPADENFFLQVYFHALGRPVAEDRYEIGRDFPRIAEIRLDMDDASGRLLATVANGDGGEFALHVRARNGRWAQVTTFADDVVLGTIGPRGDLYMVSRKDAPRGKILRLRAAELNLARATVVVPEGPDSIVTSFLGSSSVAATASSLYVTYQLGGPSELRVFGLDGRPKDKPEQPAVSSIGSITPLTGDDVLFWRNSYTAPGAWYRFAAANHETHRTALADSSTIDASRWEVRREFATSRDGTRVPLNIVMPPGAALDGSRPCVLYGYGGYGVNIEPSFWSTGALLAERGVIYAEANIRGGSEYGETWHAQGSLTHKQNVFDDFAAAAGYLVAQRYTSTERLGIMGGSNGGLLMGATLTQHPELAHAVVSYVGIYDMLRVELSPNGAFNVTEFGSVQNAEQFAALYAYSPYHHVTSTAYPATLFLTGANDPRVEPWHSRKMIARLQAANTGDRPILLRTSNTSGHGIGTALSEQIEESTDAWSFMFDALGVTVAPR
jgi:prolyl oligopeptidase